MKINSCPIKYILSGTGKASGLLLVAVVLLAGCTKPKPELRRPVRPVTVAKAAQSDVPLYLSEIGRCSAFETVLVQAQVGGTILSIHFTDGTELKKGDLLFTIDPRPFQATLDRALATLEQDRIRAANDQAQLRRSQELRRTKVISEQEMENTSATAAASQAAVTADQAAVQTARINLEYCTIRSPIDGRASKRMIDVGNVVSPNSSQLLLIQRQDPIYVDFTITENLLPKVRSFQKAGSLKVEASFPEAPSQARTGELDFIDSGVQPNSGTVRMRALLENEDRLFWPGQFVNVRLLLDVLKGVVLVPAEAIQIGEKGPYLFVVKGDATIELRQIQIGQKHGEKTVVLEGLKPEETVVVSGQIALAPGASVSIKGDLQ